MQLRSYVHIDGGVYGPGDEVPEDVADRITNPKAWQDAATPRPAPRVPASTPAPNEENEGGEDEEPQRPAKADQVGAWREYVLAVADIEETDVAEMTKAQLIDLADEIDADTGDE